MRRIISLFLVVAISATCLTGCCLKHEYAPATCEAPSTCIKCGKTEGEALGHRWEEATCSAPKTCSSCNSTEGEPSPHTWISATCTKAKTCSHCKLTYGEPNGHTPDDYTAICTVCNKPSYTLSSLMLLYVDNALEYCQLLLDLLDEIKDFINNSGSKYSYNSIMSDLSTQYSTMLYVANWVISHPDYNSSSTAMKYFGDVFDTWSLAYSAAESLDSYYTFYGYYAAVKEALIEFYNATVKLSDAL